MSPLLHGRTAELDAIVAAFEYVRQGLSSTFALVGEPGIGKSHLARKVTERATSAGFLSGWGRAWEAGGAPPYFPWRSLFEALSPLCDLRSGPLDMLRGANRAAAADPDQARFDLFEAVADGLRAACARAPLLCVLDDLHAADVPSLELAAFVTRHLLSHPILWIVTWRDVEASRAPGNELITAIARDARVLPLRRLSLGETNRFVAELSSAGANERADGEDALSTTLFRATAGNPLFIVETFAWLVARGMSHLPGGLEQLPLTEGVATVVRARVASVSPAARHALEAASLLGREIDIDRWAQAADMPEDLIRQRAAEIVASGILLPIAGSRWTFSHDLVREAICRDMPGELARAAHRRVALALDRRVKAGERALSDARVHHGLGALGAIDASIVVGWAIEASDAARAQCAYEQALAIVEQVTAALGPRFASEPSVLLARGRVLLDLGRVASAREALHAAIAATRATGDARMRALAVLALGSRYVLGDIHDDLVRMIDETMVALTSDDRDLRDLRACLLARKAAALTPAKRPDTVLAMARDAFRMVVDSKDEVARLDVCVGVGSAFGDFAHPRERIPVNEQLVRSARANRDRALELRGLSRLVTDHVEAGDFQHAAMLLPERDALARALKQPRFGWTTPLFQSMRWMAEGRFDACASAVLEAESRGLESNDANVERCIAVHRTWLLLLQDDVDALRAHEARILSALRAMPSVLSSVVRAVIRLRTGEHAACRAEVAAIDPSLPNCAMNTMVTLAEAVAEVGPPELARTLVGRLGSHADTFSIWGLFGLTCGLPVATALGRLEAAFGDRRRAAAYFESAVGTATASGARALRAWTQYAYGRALVLHLDDLDRGKVLLEDALEEATALGMGQLPARCQDVLRVRLSISPQGWSMREEAGAWRIEHAGRSSLVPALRGIPMIARLVENPDTEVHSLELVSGALGSERTAGDAGDHLDEQARKAYQRRAAELAELISDLDERGAASAADAARSDLDALRRELSRAIGLGGRARKASAATERARISAQRRIREAIRKIREVDTELAEHLDRTVQTGIFCMYAPRRRNR